MTIKLGLHLKVRTVKDFLMSLLFVLYLPTFITRIVDISYWRLICYILILVADVYFIYVMRKLKPPVITVSVFFLYFFFVTLIRDPEDILLCGARTFTGISFVLMLEFIFDRYSKARILDILMFAMEVFLYVNLISMILYPAGMYRVITNGIYEELVPVAKNDVRTNARVIWLLGHQTMLIRFTLPAVCIALLYWYDSRKKVNLRSLSLVIVCIIETIIANSAGNYMILVLFAAFCLYFIFKGKINNAMVYVGIVAIYIFAINLGENTWLLSFLSDKLGRTVSVSTRIPIWMNAISAWLKKPLFGYGYINESSSIIRNLLSLGNPHSSYFWALFEGGIVGFALFFRMIYFFGKNMKGHWKSRSALIIYSAFICLLICMIDDDHIFRAQFFLIVFSLAYHIPQMATDEDMDLSRASSLRNKKG